METFFRINTFRYFKFNFIIPTFFGIIFIIIYLQSCNSSSRLEFNIENFIILLNTSNTQLEKTIFKFNPNWDKAPEAEFITFTKNNGEIRLYKPSSHELMYVDYTNQGYKYIEYLNKLNPHPTTKNKIQFFTYKDKYLINYQITNSVGKIPYISILIVKVE